MIENEKKYKFIELRASGLSYDAIAKKLKVSKQTLLNWAVKFQREINELEDLELDSLYKTYALCHTKRIETVGATYLRILEELNKRDYSDVPTEKLIELQLKVIQQLAKEYQTPTFNDGANTINIKHTFLNRNEDYTDLLKF